jgi:hypothetical protein
MDGRFTLQAKMVGAKRIVVMQNGRQLGAVEGESGKLEVPAVVLGLGKTRVQAIGMMQVPEGATATQPTAVLSSACYAGLLALVLGPPCVNCVDVILELGEVGRPVRVHDADDARQVLGCIQPG